MKLASKIVSLGALLLLTASAAYAAPPVVVTIPNLSVNATTTTTINVVAYDPDADAITLTSSLPSWATLNPPTTGTGLVVTTITLMPTASDLGTFNGSVTATANGEATTANFQITVNASGSDQVPKVTAPASETVTAGSMLTFTVTASDAQAITSLTAASLPSGATFTANVSNTSGTFTWTPTSGQTGDFNVVFTAANALSGSATTHIHVAAANTPPVVTAPATETVTAGNLLTFTVSATDVNSDHVSLSASGLPSGATFTDNDNGTGTFMWTPTSGQTGSFTVTFTGNDGHGGTVTATTVITVNAAGVNTPPVVTAPATETVTQGNLLTFTVSATDANSDHVTLTASGLPSGATFTDNANNTGTFAWTPSSSQSGTFTVTFTGNDGHGGTATATTVITVNTSGGGGTFTASAKLLGAFNTHRKFLCFRITPDNHTFDVRNVTLSSVTLSFNGQTLTGRTSLDWECEGEDDDGGDCGDCDSQNSTCPSDTTNCSVTLKTCFTMTALRTFFGSQDIATNLMNVTFTGTLSTGGTFTATMGNVKVAGGGDKGKGHDKHALHAKATPNPLNPLTKLTFSLTKAGLVRVSVFDARGRFVKTLFEGVRNAGDQSMIWDGSDANSRKVSSGVYIFRIEAPEATDVQRVTVLK